MKINRMAQEKSAPSWAFENVDELASSDFSSQYISQEEIERIQSLPSDDLDDGQIIEQREEIEKCANSKSVYHYRSSWTDKVKSSLREYACVCGLEDSKFKPVDQRLIEAKISQETVIPEIKKKASIGDDPFHIDTKGDMSHMDASNWEDIHKQSNLDSKPTLSGGIVPVRGGEDYYANSDPNTARGQNSITDPNAIGVFAESEDEDTGARLRRENEERSNSRESKHKAWQEEKVSAMEGSDILPKGSVFATEVMNAQSGIGSDNIHMGVYSDMDLMDRPEKTDGERLSEVNEERRQEIQGAPKDDHEFHPEQNPVRGISDTFAEALKKHIK